MDTNTQRLLHTFSALADLGQEISDTNDFEEMLRNSFHLLLGSLAIRRGAVAEYDRETGTLRLIACRGFGETTDKAIEIATDHARELASFGSTIKLDEAKKEAQRLREDQKALASIEIDLLLPLVVREQLI